MSLTLQRVNSNLFLHPESIMEARVHSLDNLAKTTKTKEEMTDRWLEDCKNHHQIPFVKRLNSIDTAQLGTTFPPRTMLHPAQTFGRRDTFHSEPDLSPLAVYSDDDEPGSLCGDEDEDHLFEFDLAPEGELEDDHVDSQEPPDLIPDRLPTVSATVGPISTSAINTNTSLLGCDTSSAADQLRRRTFSDSSNGSCSHRKPLPPAAAPSEPEDDQSYRAGFSSIFGSTSSGLGSERRHSQETLIFGEEENKSFEPSQWRDYMNERLSCSEGTVTPLSSSAPDIPASVLGGGEGDGTTPILAASPCPPPAATAQDSPLISPDSLLDGQNQSYLDEHLAVPASTSCPECSLELSNLSLYDRTQTEKTEDAVPVDGNGNVKDVVSISETSEANLPDLSSPQVESPTTSKQKKIREEDLTNLLNQLDEDTHIYPGLHHVSSANSSLSAEEMGEDITSLKKVTDDIANLQVTSDETTPYRKVSAPADLASVSPPSTTSESSRETPRLRKCSSLKTGKTPPGTPGQRKIVRFADIFGLDLSEVKTFVDEIPKVPRSAFQDLDVDINDFDVGSPRVQTPVFKFKPQSSPKKSPPHAVSSSTLVPMFTQPGCSTTFYDTVRSNKVCLENAYMEAPFVIAGIVRVLNIDFNKAVNVRWTVNDWHSHEDSAASYVDGSSDGMTDKFAFRIQVGSLPVGSRVQFCLQYSCAGTEFWDNNHGGNYVFQVFLSTNSPGGGGGTMRGCSPSPSTPSPMRSSPVPVAAKRGSYTNSPYHRNYSDSPSHHGDDPWMRFM